MIIVGIWLSLFVSDFNGRAAPLSAHVFARARERFGCGGIVTVLSSGVVVVRSLPLLVS